MNNIVEIYVSGSTLPQFTHNGQDFVINPLNCDYEIGVRVPTSRGGGTGRVEVVISVDGLGIQTGKPASMNDRGYVARCGQLLKIPGWTVNNQSAARFRFAQVDDSYAALSARETTNIGVIGVAIFHELYVEPTLAHNLESLPGHFPGCRSKGVARGGGGTMGMSTASLSSNRSMDRGADSGTAFGQKVDFNVSTTELRRGSLDRTLSLYYRSRDWFQRNGIAIPGEFAASGSPFPADGGCVPPPGWHG